jgi:hypothetical protein
MFVVSYSVRMHECLTFHMNHKYHVFRRVRNVAKSGYELRHLCPSAWNSSAVTRPIVMKFDVRVFSKSCRENSGLIALYLYIRKHVLYIVQFLYFVLPY